MRQIHFHFVKASKSIRQEELSISFQLFLCSAQIIPFLSNWLQLNRPDQLDLGFLAGSCLNGVLSAIKLISFMKNTQKGVDMGQVNLERYLQKMSLWWVLLVSLGKPLTLSSSLNLTLCLNCWSFLFLMRSVHFGWLNCCQYSEVYGIKHGLGGELAEAQGREKSPKPPSAVNNFRYPDEYSNGFQNSLVPLLGNPFHCFLKVVSS